MLEALTEPAQASQEQGGQDAVLRRLNVRRMGARVVAVVNALCRPHNGRLDWFGVPAQVRVVDVQWTEGPASRRYDLLASLHWRGTAGYLGMSHLGAEAALDGHLGAVPWDALPPAVALALLQDAADQLRNAPANAFLGPVRFQGMESAESLAGPLLVVALSITPEGGGDVIRLDWLVDADGIDPGSFCHPRSPRQEMSWIQLSTWGDLPVPVAFELGWVDLPLSELHGLRSEDVLLPDCWWAHKGKGRVGLRVSPQTGWRWGLAGVFDDAAQRITVTGLQNMEQDLPEEIFKALDPADDGGPDANPFSAGDAGAGVLTAGVLGALPVRLTFDLGERSLTLEELTTIGVGHVFDLALSPRGGVNLRVNGLRVGEGEIIEIDGRIGVAVTRLVPPRV